MNYRCKIVLFILVHDKNSILPIIHVNRNADIAD